MLKVQFTSKGYQKIFGNLTIYDPRRNLLGVDAIFQIIWAMHGCF